MDNMPDFIANNPEARAAFEAGSARAELDIAHPEQQQRPLPRITPETATKTGELLLTTALQTDATPMPRAVLGSRVKKWAPGTTVSEVIIDKGPGYLQAGRLQRDIDGLTAIQTEQARQTKGKAYRISQQGKR